METKTKAKPKQPKTGGEGEGTALSSNPAQVGHLDTWTVGCVLNGET